MKKNKKQLARLLRRRRLLGILAIVLLLALMATFSVSRHLEHTVITEPTAATHFPIKPTAVTEEPHTQPPVETTAQTQTTVETFSTEPEQAAVEEVANADAEKTMSQEETILSESQAVETEESVMETISEPSMAHEINTQPQEDAVETAPTETQKAVNPLYDNGQADTHNSATALFLLFIRILLLIALILDIAGLILTSIQIHKLRKIGTSPLPEKEPDQALSGAIAVGRINNIGNRRNQQDSFGSCAVGTGLLAVLADGMGGLSSGEMVSQKIVLSALSLAPKLQHTAFDGALSKMLCRINDEVNQMLCTSTNKCGSTMVAVLIQQKRMHWISVGDSRIYLYRSGSLIQLNQEHTYEHELLDRAINGEISFEDVRRDPQINRVTSYIGMGSLKHIDSSLHSLALCPGDRILLMSDGIFNTLNELQIAAVLQKNQDVADIASQMEEQVLAMKHPNQDNFSALILGL